MRSPGVVRRAVGVVSLASALLSWSVWGLLAVVLYLLGLFNRSPLVLVPCVYISLAVPVGVAGFLCLLVLITRTVCRRFELEDRKWQRRLLSAVAVFVSVASFGLACMYGGVPVRMWSRGIVRHVQSHADIEGIQTWLSTLGPDDLDPEGQRHKDNIALERDFAKSEQPPALARLKVNRARVRADDEGHLTLRLQLGGGGFMMHWGLAVGPPEMPTPPSDFSEYGEQRFPVSPGAYVWLAE